jgi:hypothetical protein
MAKGKYYTPEFKEQAVKMAVGPHGTVFQRARSQPGLTSRYRAMAVISNRHVARLLFRRLSKPSADSERRRR